MVINGKKLYSQQDLARETGRTKNAIKQFIYRNGIEPFCNLYLYDEDVLNAIKNAPPPGRPKKAPLKPPQGKK
jgi:hypothetical protein